MLVIFSSLSNCRANNERSILCLLILKIFYNHNCLPFFHGSFSVPVNKVQMIMWEKSKVFWAWHVLKSQPWVYPCCSAKSITLPQALLTLLCDLKVKAWLGSASSRLCSFTNLCTSHRPSCIPLIFIAAKHPVVVTLWGMFDSSPIPFVHFCPWFEQQIVR